MTKQLADYSDPISRARTKTLRQLVERDPRVIGFTIEDDGVFIYTDSDEWCDDAGAGTFRGDSETAAVRDFRERVQRAERIALHAVSRRAAQAAPAAPTYRARVESRVIAKVVTDLLAAGYTVGYHDGEDLAVAPGAGTLDAIVAELHSTDEARLVIRRPDDISFRAGVYLVYGNAPWEVFCDWTDIEPLGGIIRRAADECEAKYRLSFGG